MEMEGVAPEQQRQEKAQRGSSRAEKDVLMKNKPPTLVGRRGGREWCGIPGVWKQLQVAIGSN